MISCVGLLDRWDRRNQETLRRHNDVEEVVEPGAVTVFSLPALIKIAVLALVVAVAGVMSGELWGYGAAVLALLIGGAMCLDLGRDVAEDVGDWKRRRSKRTSPGG